jgi:hypothetical protein
MAPKILGTVASDYIGGCFVDRLSQAHPMYQLVGLVGGKAQRKQITKSYSNHEPVFGDLGLKRCTGQARE